MHDHSHAIIRLPVHLPQKQPVYFREGQEEQALEKAQSNGTMLTAFFIYNASNPTDLCYPEYPLHFTFNKNKKWQPRKNATRIVSRMYSVSPKDIERYCLRLLLLHVSGPTCFDDLLIVDSHRCSSFHEACLLRHLLSDDSAWEHTLQEATTFCMPSKLRDLFVTICLHCDPFNAFELWENYKDAMIEDFIHQKFDPQLAEQLALQHFEHVLNENDMSCSDLGLPEPNMLTNTPIVPVSDEYLSETRNKAMHNMTLLNTEQRALVNAVMESMNESCHPSEKPRAFFSDGPGGPGKTMVYNTLIWYFQSLGHQVAPSAWTGIAATLLDGGRTCHNLFKLPVPITDTSVCQISPTSTHAAFLRSIKMFIIDEASMLPVHALRAIDVMLRDITNCDCPFGGKIFLLGGDFRQVLPVVPRSSRTVIVENCIKSSPLWKEFKKYRLTKNMRAENGNGLFAECLLQLGNGVCQSVSEDLPPNSTIIPQDVHASHDIVYDVFPDVSDGMKLINTVILTPKNDDALKLNDRVLNKLQG